MMSYSDLKHKNLSKHPAGFFVGLEAKNHQQSTETTYCFPLRSLISEKNALYNVCFFGTINGRLMLGGRLIHDVI